MQSFNPARGEISRTNRTAVRTRILCSSCSLPFARPRRPAFIASHQTLVPSLASNWFSSRGGARRAARTVSDSSSLSRAAAPATPPGPGRHHPFGPRNPRIPTAAGAPSHVSGSRRVPARGAPTATCLEASDGGREGGEAVPSSPGPGEFSIQVGRALRVGRRTLVGPTGGRLVGRCDAILAVGALVVEICEAPGGPAHGFSLERAPFLLPQF
ncbi:hypothetical protein NL676_032446 [Syzygium grande]|nr:hypothetical protein NL676_032446 [Syzygium grande]